MTGRHRLSTVKIPLVIHSQEKGATNQAIESTWCATRQVVWLTKGNAEIAKRIPDTVADIPQRPTPGKRHQHHYKPDKFSFDRVHPAFPKTFFHYYRKFC